MESARTSAGRAHKSLSHAPSPVVLVTLLTLNELLPQVFLTPVVTPSVEYGAPAISTCGVGDVDAAIAASARRDEVCHTAWIHNARLGAGTPPAQTTVPDTGAHSALP